jgi:hypothetical protein
VRLVIVKRSRTKYFHLVFFTAILGYCSRKFSCYLPGWLNIYLGDALWALMIYWIVAFLFPKISVLKIALISVAVCFIIELTQLYQAPWINAIRHTTLGGPVLGFGFLWTDIVSYVIGVIMGILVELSIFKLKLNY